MVIRLAAGRLARGTVVSENPLGVGDITKYAILKGKLRSVYYHQPGGKEDDEVTAAFDQPIKQLIRNAASSLSAGEVRSWSVGADSRQIAAESGGYSAADDGGRGQLDEEVGVGLVFLDVSRLRTHGNWPKSDRTVYHS